MAIINYDKDLPSNSKTEKIEKPAEVEPKKKIISGKATIKKKASLLKKFRDTFIAEDISNVKRYVFDDVLIPGIKNLFVDTISMFILGDSYRGRSSVGLGRRDRTSYSVRLDSDRRTTLRYTSAGGKYRDVVYETREDAEDVLDDLLMLIDKYGKTTVSDLYSASGITPDFTDEKFGWVDLKRATIRRVPDGYILDMPKAYPLD